MHCAVMKPSEQLILGNLCKGLVVKPMPLTSEVFKGVINPGIYGGHDLWVKCTTSAEC